MPAFSGLFQGVHGDAYSAVPKSGKPSMFRGLTRVIMQKRGMAGVVNALGQDAPNAFTKVAADRGDVVTRGGYDYVNRQQDGSNQVTVANLGTVVHGAAGTAFETEARVADPNAAALTEVFDTTRRVGHVADAAGNGVTSPAVTESVET